jgi:hypothetical protein
VLSRYRDGVFREELLPVLTEVVLPIARERFGPLLDEVGGELWAALPKLSIGWEWVKEWTVGGPGLVKARFQRFLEEQGEPIIAAHAGEIARAAAEVVRDSFREPRVREALSAAARTALGDPELGSLLGGLLKRLLLENDRLTDLVRRHWEGGLSAAVGDVLARLEPVMSRAVDAIVLDAEQTGINPRLVRVLRARVFRKDGRFVLLAPGEGPLLPDGARLHGSRNP